MQEIVPLIEGDSLATWIKALRGLLLLEGPSENLDPPPFITRLRSPLIHTAFHCLQVLFLLPYQALLKEHFLYMTIPFLVALILESPEAGNKGSRTIKLSFVCLTGYFFTFVQTFFYILSLVRILKRKVMSGFSTWTASLPRPLLRY